uniref:EGF-like domain-containing protein n=1 Tax=Strongyloides papillosus TaxID=174720 RepID=A0A0N5C3T2_STREA
MHCYQSYKSQVKLLFFICLSICFTIYLIDGCISKRTIKQIVEKFFTGEELYLNSTKNEIIKKSTERNILESIKLCPRDYPTTLKCHNGGVVKCKFWNEKIVGIPFCHCSRDYGGQYCDNPLNVAYLVMEEPKAPSESGEIFDIILFVLFTISILSFVLYLYLIKAYSPKKTFSVCI